MTFNVFAFLGSADPTTCWPCSDMGERQMPFLPPHPSSLGHEKNSCPCLSPAEVLRRMGPVSHLGDTVEQVLGVRHSSEPSSSA